MTKTFAEIAADPRGTVYHEEDCETFQFLIIRGGASLCAYVGVPLDHPLAGKPYDDFPLDCHGGLTFSDKGDGGWGHLEGYWWYGWDYAHLGDRSFYDSRLKLNIPAFPGQREWTVSMVLKDCQETLEQFAKMVNGATVDVKGE